MKKKINVLFILLYGIFLISCGSERAEFKETKELDSQEREEVNAMQEAWMASDGKDMYIAGGDIIRRVDMENKEIVVNCGELLCDHTSLSCSAKIPGGDKLYPIFRNGDHVYVVSDKIYEVSKNSKREIGHGGYGNYGCKILFGDYIAYFETEDTVVVKHVKSDKEVQRFEDIRGHIQGSFYYKGGLYYVTDVNQLVRLDIKTGEKEILEKKGITRASVYDGFIYYIKVSEETDTNWLVKRNPETGETQEVIENAFYYNMIGDTLYYVSYKGREVWRADLNGENREKLSLEEDGYNWDFMWAFSEAEKIFFCGENMNTFYLLDAKSGELNYDEPLK